MKIKFRESFRPFAPTVLEEKVGDWFELDQPSPYMLLGAQVREDRRTIPSVTHVDGSARIQTINRSQNARYYDLIKTLRGAHRLPGDHQHVVQRPRRTDHHDAARRVHVFHAHQHRLPGHGPGSCWPRPR
jgi:hypothetical protein